MLTPLKSDLSGRDRLDLLAALWIHKGQAGLLRAGTAPRVAAASLSPHRVATENFVTLTRLLRDFRARAPTTYHTLPDWLHRYAWLLDGHGLWVLDSEDGPTWVPAWRTVGGRSPRVNGRRIQPSARPGGDTTRGGTGSRIITDAGAPIASTAGRGCQEPNTEPSKSPARPERAWPCRVTR